MLSIKFIRDRISGLPSGFGFVEFSSHAVAARVLSTMNGQPIGALSPSLLLVLCAAAFTVAARPWLPRSLPVRRCERGRDKGCFFWVPHRTVFRTRARFGHARGCVWEVPSLSHHCASVQKQVLRKAIVSGVVCFARRALDGCGLAVRGGAYSCTDSCGQCWYSRAQLPRMGRHPLCAASRVLITTAWW